MLRVALTGNAASGKSLVAALWAEEGVPVVSADDLARQAVEPGSPGLAEVVEEFGEDVLRPDGSLDRDRLRRVVLSDPGARARLEAILHPRIWMLRDRWMRARAREAPPLVVSEIPLLFEAGRQDDFDVTVLVDAPEEERLRRLAEGRGLDPAEARALLDAQMDPALKRRLADYVLDNAGSLEDLRQRARALLDLLRARAARGALP